MTKLVLVENLDYSQANIITESAEGGKTRYLSGIFMQAEIENGNKRKYPLSEITNAVNFFNAQKAKGVSICGELNHPDNLSVDLKNVSHVITEMRMDGSNAIGKARLLDTPNGQIVKALIDGGVRLGVSSRGMGNVNEGTVSDFQFVTVDVVSTPSARDAYPNHVMESLQNNTKIVTLAEQVIEDQKAQKHLVAAVMKFFESLK